MDKRPSLKDWVEAAGVALLFYLFKALPVRVASHIGGVIAPDVGHSLFGGTATNTVGVVNPPPGLDTAIAHAGDAFDLRIKTRVFSSDEAADTALNAGEVDAVLAGTAQLRFKTTRDTKLTSAVAQAAAAVRAAGGGGDRHAPQRFCGLPSRAESRGC